MSEFCGSTPSRPSYLNVIDPELIVIFRSSEDLKVEKGFQMYVTCFNPEENDAEGTQIKMYTEKVPLVSQLHILNMTIVHCYIII